MSQVEADLQVPIVDPERASYVGDLSTKAIVAAVLLAVGMIVGEQLGERLDTLVTGGVFPIFGLAIHYIFQTTALLAYGFGAAMIVGNINPIVAVATATGPLAPLWFFTNTGAAIGGRLVHHYWIAKDVRVMKLWEVGAVCLGAYVIDGMIMFPVQLLYFEMPIGPLLVMKLVEMASAVILPAIVAWKAAPALKRIRGV